MMGDTTVDQSRVTAKVNYTAPEFDKAFEDDEDEVVVARASFPVHEDNADPIVPPRQVSNRPGRMRTQAEIILQTHIAHRLFYGRGHNNEEGLMPIIGLVRFSSNMNAIMGCAENDDPWADAMLIKIEDQFAAANVLIKKHIETMKNLMDGEEMEGINICHHGSLKPITVPMEFRTVYGFMGARLLAKLDKMVELMLLARHFGLFFQDDWFAMLGLKDTRRRKGKKGAGTEVRFLFGLSAKYRYTGATRDDVAANNEVARRAAAKYGELPQDILEGTRRAKHAPVIRSKSPLTVVRGVGK